MIDVQPSYCPFGTNSLYLSKSRKALSFVLISFIAKPDILAQALLEKFLSCKNLKAGV
jgi:hypothetical protein